MSYLRCDGELSVGLDGSAHCTQWVVISETELLSAVPVQQLFELLNEVFSTPEPQQLAAAFAAAFMTPMMLYLASWALSRVVSFINDPD